MTEQRGDSGFSVAPRPLIQERGRGPLRRLGIVALAVVGAAIVVVAWIGPRLSARPSLDVSFFATPVPSRTPPRPSATTPLRPETTPLPPLTNPRGLALDGTLSILTDTFRNVDLATGETTPGPNVRLGRDAIFRSPAGDGWICICFLDTLADPQPDPPLGIMHIGSDGEASSIIGPDGPPATVIRDMPGTAHDIDASRDRRHGIVVTSTQEPNDAGWSISVAGVDLGADRIEPPQTIGRIDRPPAPGTPLDPAQASSSPAAQPTPEEQVYLDGPHVRLSPDGRVAFLWATAHRYEIEGSEQETLTTAAWRIELAPDGSIETTAPTAALEQLPTFCFVAGFVSAERFAWSCQISDEAVPEGTMPYVRLFDRGGEAVADLEIPTLSSFDGQPIFDRANGLIYYWGPTSLLLTRIDTATLDVVSSSFDSAVTSTAGVAPAGGAPPEWHIPASLVSGHAFGQIATIPGDPRLFLAAFSADQPIDGMSQASLGIFVADGPTLAMLDRWAPAAEYLQLSSGLPGYIAAIGLPGMDEMGRVAPWQASITLHDATSGEIVARYGQVAANDEIPMILDR